MKKFNLMILGLAISVLMLSLVSAGITGYVLREGESIGTKQVSNIDVSTQTAVIGGEEVQVGDTIGTDQIVAIKKPFLGKPKIVFEKTTPQDPNQIGPCDYLTTEITTQVNNLIAQGENVILTEGQQIQENDYVIIGGCANHPAYLLELTQIYNTSMNYANDQVQFQNVLTGGILQTIFAFEGFGTLTIGGIQYGITFSGSDDEGIVTIDYGCPETISFEDCFETTPTNVTNQTQTNDCSSCQGILDMIKDSCHVTSFMNMGNLSIGQTCDELCSNVGETCIMGSFEEYGYIGGQRVSFYSGDLINCDYPMYASSFGGTTNYNCMCCSV